MHKKFTVKVTCNYYREILAENEDQAYEKAIEELIGHNLKEDEFDVDIVKEEGLYEDFDEEV